MEFLQFLPLEFWILPLQFISLDFTQFLPVEFLWFCSLEFLRFLPMLFLSVALNRFLPLEFSLSRLFILSRSLLRMSLHLNFDLPLLHLLTSSVFHAHSSFCLPCSLILCMCPAHLLLIRISSLNSPIFLPSSYFTLHILLIQLFSAARSFSCISASASVSNPHIQAGTTQASNTIPLASSSTFCPTQCLPPCCCSCLQPSLCLRATSSILTYCTAQVHTVSFTRFIHLYAFVITKVK